MERNVADPGDAAELARRCAADALKAGVNMREMEDEAGPLEDFIGAALAHARDRL